MRKSLLALTTVLLACMLILSSGVVALADAAVSTPPSGMAALFAPGEMPPVSPNGFIAPIPPRDPKAKPISTVAQLRAMANGGNYYLTQDIDLSSYNKGVWQPLMMSVTLDGQGHIIKNLYIPASTRQRVAGLFGVVMMNCNFTVKNLGIQLRTGGITAYNALAAGTETEYPVFSGGLVAVADSNYPGKYAVSISNCYVLGDVAGAASGANQNALVGGMAGMVTWCAPVSIVNCYTTGHVRSTSDRDESSIGGVVGSLGTGTVNHCYSSCDVSAMNGDYVSFGLDIGGLVGSVGGIRQVSISNSHASGAVSANASSYIYIGGLVGEINESFVTNCSASGKVSATTPDNSDCFISAGGLVGRAYCPSSSAPAITGCLSTGAVDAVAINNGPAGKYAIAWAGGLIGSLQAKTISDCYATGAVNAAATSVTTIGAGAGGLAGNMVNCDTATNCYATGPVSATKTLGSTSQAASAGGVVGETYRSSGISNCYFDNQTTGQAQATGDGVSAPDAGKTTDQMKAQATYNGWDFASVWGIGSERNNGYPYLQWQYMHLVFFDSRGGSAVAEQSVNDGANAAAPTKPTRAGYSFAGWYKDSACSALWNFATDTVTGDTTLYAKWIKKQYVAITAKSNNLSYGSVTGTGSYAVGTSVTVKATPKAGCRFVRWLEGTTAVSTSPAYTFTVTRARALKAEFAKIGKPTVKAASAVNNGVKLTWTAVAGAQGYEVYRATSSTGSYTKLTEITSVTYTNTGLTTGKAYYYKVRAKCVAGSTITYGSYSAIVSAKPGQH